jgi:hypothetical protein
VKEKTIGFIDLLLIEDILQLEDSLLTGRPWVSGTATITEGRALPRSVQLVLLCQVRLDVKPTSNTKPTRQASDEDTSPTCRTFCVDWVLIFGRQCARLFVASPADGRTMIVAILLGAKLYKIRVGKFDLVQVVSCFEWRFTSRDRQSVPKVPDGTAVRSLWTR